MNYTKGEWEVITNGSSLLGVAIQGRNICSFEPLFLHGEKSNLFRQLGGEDEANAHLIATAPELHEACKLASMVLKKLGMDTTGIDKAIAKVEGGS